MLDAVLPNVDARANNGGGRPLAMPLQDAYSSLCHDRKVGRAVRRIPLPLLYFCSFVSMLFTHIPASSMYEQGFAVSSALATTGSDAVTANSSVKFDSIAELSDVFDWLSHTFVPSVFITQDYNHHALSQDRWGRVAMFNKVLGAVNLQVTRKAVHLCDTQPFLADLYPYCYDSSNTTVEQRLISFDTNVTEAASQLATLKTRGNWLDFSAQQLLITIVTYNGELQGYAVTELQLDFSEGGAITASSSTTPALSNPYGASTTIPADLVVLVFFLLAVGMQVRRLYRHRREGVRVLVCDTVWVVVEHASSVVVVVFYAVWFSIVRRMFQKEFRDDLASLVVGGKNWMADADAQARLTSVTKTLKTVAELTVALRLIATLAVFLLGLRILKRFRFHPRLSILTRTVATALHQFGAFFVVFVVIFVTFAVSGTVLFGDRVAEFSALSTAMETCINMLFGNFDYDSIQGLYAPVSMLYYWGYMIVVSLVLLNMMLAIVLDAYAEVSSESYKAPSNVTLSRITGNMLWTLTLAIHELRCCGSRRSRKDQAAKTKPQVTQATERSDSPFKELPHDAVVFRGRIRPDLLERRLLAILQAGEKGSASSRANPTTMLTPQTLIGLFPAANLEECEVRATLQHLLDGLVLPGPKTEEEQKEAGQKVASSGAASEPIPIKRQHCEGPSAEDIAPRESVENAGTELQRMALQLAELERKLDLLLVKAAL
ncbi:hypothetical protein BBJ28_00004927 [Nothophytophthora sp. Chile5]|nr:hypothetical protein BBJ28_00004927 [Nothophytophthora sp. Chile5]